MLLRHSVLPFLCTAGVLAYGGDFDYDVLQYIDPLIGSAEGGMSESVFHVYKGYL